MKIECLLLRDGGTVVTFPTESYHFAPEEKGGPHVCEVTDETHIQRLLSAPEAYRVYGAERQLNAPAQAPGNEPPIDPYSWSSQAVQQWAEAHGINYRDRRSIISYGEEQYQMQAGELPQSMAPTELLKRIIARAHDLEGPTVREQIDEQNRQARLAELAERDAQVNEQNLERARRDEEKRQAERERQQNAEEGAAGATVTPAPPPPPPPEG